MKIFDDPKFREVVEKAVRAQEDLRLADSEEKEANLSFNQGGNYNWWKEKMEALQKARVAAEMAQEAVAEYIEEYSLSADD